MRNRFYFVIPLFAASLNACQKESAPLVSAPTAGNPETAVVETQLSFSVGDRSYTLAALPFDDSYGQEPSGCGGSSAETHLFSYEKEWTQYAGANKELFISRQDDATNPAVQIALSGKFDLDNAQLPAKVANARLVLSDLYRTIVPRTDDPTDQGALKISGETVEATITHRSADQIKGVFSGALTTASGHQIVIKNGIFSAQLNRK